MSDYVETLLGLDDLAYQAHVEGYLGDDAMFALLIDHRVAHRTRAAVVALDMSVNTQLAQRKADLDQASSDCYAAHDRQGWFDAKREYDTWHKRALLFKGLLMKRLGQVNPVVNAIKRGDDRPGNRAWDLLMTLAQGIRDHRDAATGDKTEQDKLLWQLLDLPVQQLSIAGHLARIKASS